MSKSPKHSLNDKKSATSRFRRKEEDLINPEKIFEVHNATGNWSCFCQICVAHFKYNESKKNTQIRYPEYIIKMKEI